MVKPLQLSLAICSLGFMSMTLFPQSLKAQQQTRRFNKSYLSCPSGSVLRIDPYANVSRRNPQVRDLCFLTTPDNSYPNGERILPGRTSHPFCNYGKKVVVRPGKDYCDDSSVSQSPSEPPARSNEPPASSNKSLAWSQRTQITKAQSGKSSIDEPVIMYTNTKIQGISDCGPLSESILVLNLKNKDSDRIKYEILESNSFGNTSDVSFRFGGCIQLQRDIDQGRSPQPFYPLIVDAKTH